MAEVEWQRQERLQKNDKNQQVFIRLKFNNIFVLTTVQHKIYYYCVFNLCKNMNTNKDYILARSQCLTAPRVVRVIIVTSNNVLKFLSLNCCLLQNGSGRFEGWFWDTWLPLCSCQWRRFLQNRWLGSSPSSNFRFHSWGGRLRKNCGLGRGRFFLPEWFGLCRWRLLLESSELGGGRGGSARGGGGAVENLLLLFVCSVLEESSELEVVEDAAVDWCSVK